MGNVSGYVEIIIRRLNAGIIARAGYTGGNMVHHNDESGNPFTPGEDFPVLFFIPGQMPKSASNSHELMSIYEECTRLSYVVERNSGFCLKKPQINAPATTFRT